MQIGEKLKEARLEKGLSLEEVSKMTKIQTRHLEAVEKNKFSLIPGNFYVRVFIKEYANTVGLDANELFEEHQDEIPLSDQAIDYSQLQRSRRKTASVKSSPFATIIPTIVVLILIIGVGFFIWRFALNQNDSPETDPSEEIQVDQSSGAGDKVSLPPADEGEENQNEEDQDNLADDENAEDVVDEEEEEEEEDEEPELDLVSFENNVSNYQLITSEESLELLVESSNANWLEIEDDAGERLYYATLSSNDSPVTFDISEEEHVYLRFGNPGEISISINDLEVEFAEEMSRTAVQELWLYINEDPT